MVERAWRGFCKLIVAVFYDTVEVVGEDNLPAQGSFLLCANHFNSLADVILLQHASHRLLHPLARSGLFKKPVLRWVLRFIQAVPIYRAHDQGSDTAQNKGSFSKCYEMLNSGGGLLIFPEGISHSKPTVQEIKTGAARIALGSALGGGPTPALIPAGLTFVEKGAFRGRVLIQFGKPIDVTESVVLARNEADAMEGGLDAAVISPPADPVHQITEAIERGIRALTLNDSNWQDLTLIRQLERFFHFRAGRRPSKARLAKRFRTFKRLIQQKRYLETHAPNRLQSLRRKLRWFEKLRGLYGIDDYHLDRQYSWSRAVTYGARNALVMIMLSPLALFGIITSALPFFLTRTASRRLAAGTDQFDTSEIVTGLVTFSLFWGVQLWWIFERFGVQAATVYGFALPIGAAAALTFLGRRDQIAEDARGFFLFRKRQDLQEYLLERRREIEHDLAVLAQLAKTGSHKRTGDPR